MVTPSYLLEQLPHEARERSLGALHVVPTGTHVVVGRAHDLAHSGGDLAAIAGPQEGEVVLAGAAAIEHAPVPSGFAHLERDQDQVGKGLPQLGEVGELAEALD